MQDQDYHPALIPSKLHRPALPVDLVPQPRLTAWLEQRRERQNVPSFGTGRV